MITASSVWLVRAPVDMRRGIDSLTVLAQQHAEGLWKHEAAFIFTNKTRTRIKILRWDKHGVWLCQRRLHGGTFSWPKEGDVFWHLTEEQFSWLSAGVNWQRMTGITLQKIND